MGQNFSHTFCHVLRHLINSDQPLPCRLVRDPEAWLHLAMIALDAYVQDVAACAVFTSTSAGATSDSPDSSSNAGARGDADAEVGVEAIGIHQRQESSSDATDNYIDDFTPGIGIHPDTDTQGQGPGKPGQGKPDIWVRNLFAQVVEYTYDFHQSNHQSNPHQRSSLASRCTNHLHSAASSATASAGGGAGGGSSSGSGGNTAISGSASLTNDRIYGEKSITNERVRGLILLVLEGLLRVVMKGPSNSDHTAIARLAQLLLNLLGYNNEGRDMKSSMKDGTQLGQVHQQPPQHQPPPLQGCGGIVNWLGKDVLSIMGMVTLVCTDHMLSSSSSSSSSPSPSSTTTSEAIMTLVALSKVLLVDMQLMQHMVTLHRGICLNHNHHHNNVTTSTSSPLNALHLLLPRAPGMILQGVLRWMTGCGTEISPSSSSSSSLSSSGSPIVDTLSPTSRAHIITMAVSLLWSYTFEIVPYEATIGTAMVVSTNGSHGLDQDKGFDTDAMVVCPSHGLSEVAGGSVDALGNSSMIAAGCNSSGGDGSIDNGSGGISGNGGVVMDCGDVMELVTLCHQICLDEGLYRNHLTGDTLGHRVATLLHLWVIERSPQYAPCPASQLWPRRQIKDALVVLGQIYAVLYHFPMTGSTTHPQYPSSPHTFHHIVTSFVSHRLLPLFDPFLIYQLTSTLHTHTLYSPPPLP